MLTMDSLSADQHANARTIISVGLQKGFSRKGLIVGIATACQESNLKNLNYGDRDSVGLFQQRPSQGWGTVAELTTPTIAAGKFFDALAKVRGWESMPVTMAAQKVQRSAFPMAYAKWEPLATQLVDKYGSGAPATSSDVSSQTVVAGNPLDPNTYLASIGESVKRIGLTVLGVLLIVIALVRITRIDKVVTKAGTAYVTRGASLLK